jgi:hypothetical protein
MLGCIIKKMEYKMEEQFPENPNNQQKLTINNSEKSFASVIQSNYLGEELKEVLHSANVLLVPNEGYGEDKDLIYFPSGTSDLYQFLVEKQDENLNVNICIEDSEYKELSLHADWMIIAEIVVKDFLAPLLAALLAEYIIRHLGKRVDDTNVKSKLTVVNEEDSQQIEYYYEGPATEYKEIMTNAVSNFAQDITFLNKKKSKRRHHRKKKAKKK